MNPPFNIKTGHKSCLDTLFVSGVVVSGCVCMQQPRTQKACLGYIVIRGRIMQWPETGSNRRHGDFQSPALPTELSGLKRCVFNTALLNRVTLDESRRRFINLRFFWYKPRWFFAAVTKKKIMHFLF